MSFYLRRRFPYLTLMGQDILAMLGYFRPLQNPSRSESVRKLEAFKMNYTTGTLSSGFQECLNEKLTSTNPECK